MQALLRAAAILIATSGLLSCATPRASKSVGDEYTWAMMHGGCNCGPVAYATGSTTGSWLSGQSVASYVHDRAMRCPLRQFIVAAAGDGVADVTSDMALARARAAPFVRVFLAMKLHRFDTLVVAGPHVAHPSTVVVICPNKRLPPQSSF